MPENPRDRPENSGASADDAQETTSGQPGAAEAEADRPARPYRTVRVRPRTRVTDEAAEPEEAAGAGAAAPTPGADAARERRDAAFQRRRDARAQEPADRPRIVDPTVRSDRADRPAWTDPSFNRPAPRVPRAPRRDGGRGAGASNDPGNTGRPERPERRDRGERSERFSGPPPPRQVTPASPVGPGKRTKQKNPSLPPGRRPAPPRQPLTANRGLSPMQSSRTPQYLVIGHICADLTPEGEVILGGTALYSALTAARLGWRVGVLTRGAFGGEYAGMKVPSLDEFGGEISIICQDAEVPTTFINVYKAGRREQTMPHWAGPIDLRGLPPHWRNARVIHLGPIAQEIDQKQTGALTPQFLGITPQGWMREWPRPGGGRVRLTHLRLAPELANRTDGVIVSIEEISESRDVVEQIGAQRLGVITKGESGARVIYGGESIDLPGFNVPTVDLTGAGDVFAAAFFTKAADRSISALNAGRFANAVAALSLRGVGISAVPSLRDVESLLATNRGR